MRMYFAVRNRFVERHEVRRQKMEDKSGMIPSDWMIPAETSESVVIVLASKGTLDVEQVWRIEKEQINVSLRGW